MRLVFALTLALAACGGETSPTPSRCTPGTFAACACANGSGSRPCLADGTYGGCSCPMPDAGAVDAMNAPDVPCGGLCGAGTVCESGRCVLVDAGTLDVSAADARDGASEDVDTRCPNPYYPSRCTVPEFGDGCFNLLTSNYNNILPARHCGACSRQCPEAFPMCVQGRCTEAFDAGVCPDGRGECDGDPATRCETDTTANVWSCGECGRACSPGYRCCRGTCVMPGDPCQ